MADVDSIIASLPSDIQDAIRALVAQELAKNVPPPPKQLTPSEQATLYLSQARAALGGENVGFQIGEIVLHDRVLSVLENLVAKVYDDNIASLLDSPATVPVTTAEVEAV
jgi:hypothetical protein